MVSTGTRKVRSGLIVTLMNVRRLFVISFLRIWQPSLSLGKGVQIGRGTRFRIIHGKVRIDDRVSLEDDVLIHVEGGEVSIGSNTFVGRGSQIVALEKVKIGKDVLIATRCVIRDANHRFDDVTIPIRLQGHTVSPVVIGDDVWLGAHVVITAGSDIGRGSIIGANAVVRGSIPELSIAVGTPAKVVNKRGGKPD
jgi:acetyltransferase-like isoleucine patch superfamily enzyme